MKPQQEELAEKIYASEVCKVGGVSDPEYVFGEVAKVSIMMAQVFYDVKKKKMMEVKEGER